MYLKESRCLLIARVLSYVQCLKGKWDFATSDIHSNQESQKFSKFSCRKGIHIGKLPRETKGKANFIKWQCCNNFSAFLSLILSLFYRWLKVLIFWLQWNNNLVSIGKTSVLWHHYRNPNGESKVMNQPLEPKAGFSRSEFRSIYSALEAKLVLPLCFLCSLGE